MQVAVVCEVMEADQQCELEALSNWPGNPRLRVSVTLDVVKMRAVVLVIAQNDEIVPENARIQFPACWAYCLMLMATSTAAISHSSHRMSR